MDATRNRRPSVSTRQVGTVVATAFLVGVAAAAWAGRTPFALLWLYLALSAASFALYVKDKHAARAGQWRTPEKTLHLLSLLGGWPGALCAQQLLRHKSRKQPFRAVFWFTVALNLAGLGYVLTRRSRSQDSMWDSGTQEGNHVSSLRLSKYTSAPAGSHDRAEPHEGTIFLSS